MRVHYKPVCCLEDGLKRPKRPFFRYILQKYSSHIIILSNAITLLALYFMGILAYITEQDFAKFKYPKDVGDLRRFIDSIDKHRLISESLDLNNGINKVNYETIDKVIKETNNLHIEPLEQFRYYNFSIDIQPDCRSQWGLSQIKSTLLPNTIDSSSQQRNVDKITVIIVVKSAVNNYLRRHAIRNSWYLNKDIDLYKFKTVFIVGKCHESNTKPYLTKQYNYNGSWSVGDCEREIKQEAHNFGDIVQSSAIDSYYNNTIKTFMTYSWITQRCPSDFALTIDDDYVFEVNNFINHLRKLPQVNIPEFAKSFNESQPDIPSTQNLTLLISSLASDSNVRNRSSDVDSLRKLSKQFLWSGYLRYYVRPIRVVFNKWYINLDECSYNRYPPFVTGGAVLMSFKTVKYFHYATFFTNSFKFDDVYVGILAYKLKITPFHSEDFMCHVNQYLDSNPIRSNVTRCIAVHDIEATKLVDLWKRRNETSKLDSMQEINYKS